MADIQVIRSLHLREGWSERRIAEEFHLGRRTVHKYLSRADGTEPPTYQRAKPAAAPKMGPYQGLVDQWLRADQKAPIKQRHTAARIRVRLADEYGADLSDSTVRHFVAQRRAALGLKAQTVFLHLEFSPGDVGQVDWGEATVEVAGRQVKVWMFCMRLCYSTASFVALYPHGRMEAFLDGHVRAFEFFGGVPHTIIYDNLRSAVARLLRGRGRVRNQRFETLVAHYVFDPVFATPASGWEKGLVENLVGTVRRAHLVPVPKTPSLAAFNHTLVDRLLADRSRTLPERGGQSVGDLWDGERPYLLALPAGKFRPSTSFGVIVSKQSTVRHLGVQYSVPAAYVTRKLRLEAHFDHVEVYDQDRRVARHDLGVSGQPPVLDLDHYLDVLTRKPGGVRHARVVNQLGQEVRAYRDAFLAHNPDAYRAFVDILLLCRRFTREAVLAGIAKARAERVYDVARVESFIADGLEQPMATISVATAGPLVRQPALDPYDALVPVAGVIA